MPGHSILPASDRRSPFYINVPPHDAKPITHLVSYFKLWKHFVASLITFLKDLLMAKDFELNLNLQLIGSIQFPGYKDLPYKCVSNLEQQLPSPTTTQSSTPKNETNFNLGSQQAPASSKETNRPNLPKTKSSSFLKNPTFGHRKTGSLTNLVPEASTSSATSNNNNKSSGSKGNGLQGVNPSILAAKFAPKSDETIDPTYFPSDSLFTNMGAMLVKDRFSTYTAQVKLCREIKHKLIPKLESLHRNIGVKIKEIKTSLKNESFANATLIKEVSKTGTQITNFVNSVGRYSSQQPVIRKSDTEDEDEQISLNDPFLVKLQLDYQIKNQLIHENYIFALYVNLQTISKDLFNYLVKDLNSVTEKLIKSLSSEAVYATSLENCLYNLGATLKGKLKSPDRDWQYFMVHNPNFLNVYHDEKDFPKRETRSFKDIVVPYASSVHSKCLRCGYLHKKQKVMKSYVSYFYLLTCNYLHEFKVEANTDKQKTESSGSSTRKKAKGKIGGVVDHESTPIKSYNLNDYTIQMRNEKEFKFVLTKSSNTSQKFTFKCQNEADFKAWSTDLHDLLKFSSQHTKRFRFIEAKMAHRDLEFAGAKSTKNEPQSSSQAGLNLGKLLPGDASLNKIQSTSLNGMFTPKVQSPSNKDENPFETRGKFEHSLPLESVNSNLEGATFGHSERESESPHAQGPMSNSFSVENPGIHQSENDYFKIQNEILLQQQQLLLTGSGTGDRPSLSRHSSSESVLSVMEQNNHNLSHFLSKNLDFMNDFGEHRPSDSSLNLVPSVQVLQHDSTN